MLYIEEEEKKVHPIYATPPQQKKKKNLYKSNDRLEIVIRPLAPKKLSVLTPKYRTLCCAEPGRTILSSGKKKKKFQMEKKKLPQEVNIISTLLDMPFVNKMGVTADNRTVAWPTMQHGKKKKKKSPR